MNDWFLLCLARTVVEYLQITGSVQHIVNLWTIHNRLRKWQKTQVSEQHFLEGSRGPPVGHPWRRRQTVMACSHRRRGLDKTVLSRPRRRCEQAITYARSSGRKCVIANGGVAHRRYDECQRDADLRHRRESMSSVDRLLCGWVGYLIKLSVACYVQKPNVGGCSWDIRQSGTRRVSQDTADITGFGAWAKRQSFTWRQAVITNRFLTFFSRRFSVFKVFPSTSWLWLLGVWQWLAVVLLVGAADEESSAGFWANVVVLTNLLT